MTCRPTAAGKNIMAKYSLYVFFIGIYLFHSRSLHREEEEGEGSGSSSELTSTFKVTRKGLREDAFDPDKAADKGDVIYYRCEIPVKTFSEKVLKIFVFPGRQRRGNGLGMRCWRETRSKRLWRREIPGWHPSCERTIPPIEATDEPKITCIETLKINLY